MLKPLLLDQTVIAGLGNIYVDESLFRARLHPLTPAREVKPPQAARLWRSIREVLEDAIEAEGSSFDTFYRTPTGNPGDNDVNSDDVSRLGFYYGDTAIPYGDARGDLDVGPTSNNSTHGLPQTDSSINFEDLMMFAINFLNVSATAQPAGVVDVVGGRVRLEMCRQPCLGIGNHRAQLDHTGRGPGARPPHTEGRSWRGWIPRTNVRCHRDRR